MAEKTIETCLSPELIKLYDLNEKTVVIIDVFRATSVMVTALSQGVKEIMPFGEVEDCRSMKGQGYMIAGERGGAQIEGFDLGNSPLAYLDQMHRNKKLAMTTTNGTLALKKSMGASEIVIGAFLNLSSLVEWLIKNDRSVILHCAGWKGMINFEDTLFAGAVVDQLSDRMNPCDASMMAADLYSDKKDGILEFLLSSSHAQRLKKINEDIVGDIEHCCKVDLYNHVPVYKDGFLK